MPILPSKIVVVDMISAIVIVMLQSRKIVSIIDIDRVIFVSIGSASKSQGRGPIIKVRIHVHTIFLAPTIKHGSLKLDFSTTN